jgi:hypothetical protein
VKFKTLTGAVKNIYNVNKYKVDWNKASRSKFQTSVKKYIYKYWSNHIVFEEFTIPGTRLSLDFYNANKKVAIEVQGNQHVKYTPFFHGGYKSNFLHQLKRDQEKYNFCKINDIILVEIYGKDKLNKSLFKKYGVFL